MFSRASAIFHRCLAVVMLPMPPPFADSADAESILRYGATPFSTPHYLCRCYASAMLMLLMSQILRHADAPLQLLLLRVAATPCFSMPRACC